MLDVAKLAQVSKKTVSRVLNDEPNVRKETIERVKQAMAELNYRPSLSARSLATNRSYLIALLYDNPVAHYIMNVQTGVMEHCKSQHYSVVIQPCPNFENNIEKTLSELVIQSNVDGFILTPPLSDSENVIQCIEKLGKPFVRVAPANSHVGSDCVHCNDYQSSFEMIEYLIELGHRRIGCVIGHPNHSASEMRFNGYKDALRAHGLNVDKELIVQGYFNFESGKQAGKTLLSLDQVPTAIFAGNDDMAAGVMAVAHQLEFRIPQQLSIAGFDDDPLAAQIWPPLTTVRQPVVSMAKFAAKMLIDNLRENDQGHLEHRLPCEIVLRESTGKSPS